MEFIMNAFADITQWGWLIPIGVIVGIFVGAVPGFSSTNTLIILLPLTLGMDSAPALGFMSSVYAGAQTGGSIPAVLLNVPGTGSAAATCLDGYPMTQQGKGQQALMLSFLASCIGGFITTGVTLMTLPYLRRVVYLFGSVENFIIILFGLALIVQIAGKSKIKGYMAGFFGLLLGAIGYDTVYSIPRATFGILELFDGMPSVPAIVGLFAISEVFFMMEKETVVDVTDSDLLNERLKSNWAATWDGIVLSFKHTWTIIYTAFIGWIIGIIPGAGATIASFVAYQQTMIFSKDKESFGKGNPKGVIASESANNGVTSGALIPLLTLGIPGGGTAAVMLIVLQAHGVPIGPRLFQTNPQLAYTVVATMLVAYIIMTVIGFPITKALGRISYVPTKILVPTIVSFTLIGAFVERGFMFDMYLALLFGILGYIMKKTGYQLHALLLGIILGPMAEEYFLRGITLGEGNPLIFFSRPVGNLLWILLVASMALPALYTKYSKKKKGALNA